MRHHPKRAGTWSSTWDTPLIRKMVADGALDLLSDRGAFVNGQTSYVDGGYTTAG